MIIRRSRFEDGLSVDRRLARLCPSDPLVHYNLACSFSLTEEFQKRPTPSVRPFIVDTAILMFAKRF